MKKIALLFCVISMMAVSMFTSCVSQKKILYLQNEQMLNDSSSMSIIYENERTFDYKIQPGDNLYIRIVSLDDKFTAYFNNMNQSSLATGSSNSSGNASIYLNGYSVGEDGNIDMPFVGNIYVKDLTVDEIQYKVQNIMNEYLKELGELCGINKPVTITYYKGNQRIDDILPKYALLGTHTGRRTFICNALMMGIPPQVVMKWTGHSDYKAMKPYIDVADAAKADAMKLFNKK